MRAAQRAVYVEKFESGGGLRQRPQVKARGAAEVKVREGREERAVVGLKTGVRETLAPGAPTSHQCRERFSSRPPPRTALHYLGPPAVASPPRCAVECARSL